jgi:hypothetical protein
VAAANGLGCHAACGAASTPAGGTSQVLSVRHEGTMKNWLLSFISRSCSFLAVGVILLAIALHLLTGHAAWFTEVMYRKGGPHEMDAETLHSLAVAQAWSVHRIHTFYLTIVALLLGVIATLAFCWLKEVNHSENQSPSQ